MTVTNGHSNVQASQILDTHDSFNVETLTQLCHKAQKILLHMDGRHGDLRQYCEAQSVIDRAKTEAYLILDLGHVLRLYFGDDYFDIILESHVVHQRPEEINALVAALVQENKDNI